MFEVEQTPDLGLARQPEHQRQRHVADAAIPNRLIERQLRGGERRNGDGALAPLGVRRSRDRHPALDVTLERGNQKRTLRLREYPEIAVFIESIRGTLAGDRKALERVYRLELHGGQERWTLVMFPSDAKLAAMVLRIDVTGTRDRVRGIEILQADGDRSVLSVERVAGAAAAAK